jgi:hypothetical protein
MERIKKIDFRGNPITKVPKYRDYIVILSKSLCIILLKIRITWWQKNIAKIEIIFG